MNDLNIQYDVNLDVVTIAGQRYSGDLFRQLVLASPGTWLRINERRDGALVVCRVSEETEKAFDLMAGIRLRV